MFKRTARRREIEKQLYLADQTQQQIADKLGLNQKTVSKDLNIVHAELVRSTLHLAAEIRERSHGSFIEQIERLEKEREYLVDLRSRVEADLVESRSTYQETRRDATLNDAGALEPSKTVSVLSHKREGDPRLISQVRQITDSIKGVEEAIASLRGRIIDLYGANAPTKIAQTDPEGKPLPRSGNVIFIGKAEVGGNGRG